MYLLKTIEIKKLFNKYDKSINFHRDVNFFIGENGTGKTTILRIILGILNLKIRSLWITPFIKAKLIFSDYEHRKSKNIVIEILKEQGLMSVSFRKGRDVIDFKIPMAMYNREYLYNREHQLHRLYLDRENLRSRHLPMMRSEIHNKIEQFKEKIEKNIAFDDLSVERLSFNNLNREGDTSINKIVEEIIESLEKYFYALYVSAVREEDILKKTYVTSLLKSQEEVSLERSLSVDEIKDKLVSILKTFSVDETEYKNELKNFIKRYRKEMKDKILKPDSKRMVQIVGKYDEVEEKKKKICYPRTVFLTVVNALLKNKELKYEESNEDSTLFVSQDGENLELEQLSSGEKHMLILLGKTLLQKNSPKIFIADEPEISLHIAWQEQIVSAIRKLNENAQIIFATHSPEIVSIYGEKIHNLSEKK